jgi:hypothetical protein
MIQHCSHLKQFNRPIRPSNKEAEATRPSSKKPNDRGRSVVCGTIFIFILKKKGNKKGRVNDAWRWVGLLGSANRHDDKAKYIS